MYALLALCHVLAPTRLDDNIMNIVRERYGEQIGRMGRGYVFYTTVQSAVTDSFFLNVRSEEGLSTFEELFLYACPKFICANSPPYDDPVALASMLDPPTPISPSSQNPNTILCDPTQRHLRAMSSHYLSLTPVSSLKSLLKLYTSLDAQKLTGFLDTSGAGTNEEEVLSWMMVMKNAGRCVGRVNTGGLAANGEKDNEERTRPSESLLHGEWMSISDLNFVIDQVCYILPLLHLG